ncbi:MAG: addiction module toxin, HicA family [Candidatus Diapherotrites archaeon]|jgi:predicted RNA binding protein YcfA (HicA-like mRNA interferase family)|uniref:Addiction module toxin, HicA family n=1 Tax=Candidatus Iainarchaeum sp. TaxID=3101447 RepID=A0A7K4BY70_9ARCH|nr:addiction module toxin, HicA family [Candidatus Diapherotrites archaeon]
MKLPIIYPQELCKIVLKLGFVEERQKGSHKTFVHLDGRKLTIPFHSNKPIPVGLLNKIMKQDLNITREELVKLL